MKFSTNVIVHLFSKSFKYYKNEKLYTKMYSFSFKIDMPCNKRTVCKDLIRFQYTKYFVEKNSFYTIVMLN